MTKKIYMFFLKNNVVNKTIAKTNKNKKDS